MGSVLERTIEGSEQLSQKSEHFCRYLGLVALLHEQQTSSEHLEQQIVTEYAESLDTEMGTHSRPIELRVRDHDLYDIDGRSMSASAVTWSKVQVARATQRPELAWFARIAQIEAREHSDVAQFYEEANTGDVRIKVSLFAEEAYQNPFSRQTVAQEGFRPDLKRAFIRVYEKTPNGIREHIQSVDSSSLSAWNEALHQSLGLSPSTSTEELLARNIDVPQVDPSELIERITMTYDQILQKRTGLRHSFGRSPGASVEANQFVRGHMSIVHDTILQLREIQTTGHAADKAAERILYNGKALMEKLFNGEAVTADVRAESETAGAVAAAQGKEYYGCSGASGAFAEQSAQLSHELTFSMLNGMEGVAIERCPQCGASCIVAIRDKRTGRYSCINKSCSGYNKSMVDAANGTKSTSAQQSFTDAVGDLLTDLFSTKKRN